MEREQLINIAKIKMDEFTPPGVSLPFDDTIGPLLDESAREILLTGPIHLLNATNVPLTDLEHVPPISIVKYENSRSYIPVPSDYVRLVEIKYPLWEKSVRKAITPDNPAYKVQEHKYLSAGYARPFVCVLDTTIDGVAKKYFECGKVLNPGIAPLIPVATYIKMCGPENLNDQFGDALTSLCASKAFGVLGLADKSKLMNDEYIKSLIAIAQ